MPARPPVPSVFFALLLIPAIGPRPAAAGVFPGAEWETVSPETVELDAAKLDELAALVGGSGLVVRQGYVAHAWGDPAERADWASASKPVLTTLLLMADARGLCGLDDAIGDWLPGGSPKDSAITFRQLANMVSGYSRAEEPGEAWAYNDVAINLYGHVLCERVFGAAPSSVFEQEFAFLGFQDGTTISDTQFGRIKVMSIRDFARLGLFWLERGTWDGTTVIPESYFELTSDAVDPGLSRTVADGPESWDLGSFGGTDDQDEPVPGHYGMNFWVNSNGLWPGHSADIFQASGHAGAEVCFVVPGLDLVACGVGSWGAPGDSRSRDVVRLLHEANTSTAVGVEAGVTESSWGRTKQGYLSP
jgi:CubicO group peptidase (beta-lactamase class C family)